ncbi:MAG TPA: hypothetical protein VKA31_06005 [Mariprofundaceae bacterium]|nr:hypothetical protein [Mariprofundaceae bacterium]
MLHSNLPVNLLWRLAVIIGLTLLSACACKHDVNALSAGKQAQVEADESIAMAGQRQPRAMDNSKDVQNLIPGSAVQETDAKPKQAPLEAPSKHVAVVAKSDGKASAADEAEKKAGINLDMLIKRLKQTPAIGVFTKLAIRGDILDLKDEIQSYKQKSMLQSKLDDIRARFDGLLIKIMALLQADPALSKDLYTARESIWKSLLGGST